MQLARCGKLLGIPVRPMPYDCSRDRKLAREYQGRLKFCKLNVDENSLGSRQVSGYEYSDVTVFQGWQGNRQKRWRSSRI